MLHSYTFVLAVSSCEIQTPLFVSHMHSRGVQPRVLRRRHAALIKRWNIAQRCRGYAFSDEFVSRLWTLGSWRPPRQPLYVNNAVIRPEWDISKIVPAHSHQRVATHNRWPQDVGAQWGKRWREEKGGEPSLLRKELWKRCFILAEAPKQDRVIIKKSYADGIRWSVLSCLWAWSPTRYQNT